MNCYHVDKVREKFHYFVKNWQKTHMQKCDWSICISQIQELPRLLLNLLYTEQIHEWKAMWPNLMHIYSERNPNEFGDTLKKNVHKTIATNMECSVWENTRMFSLAGTVLVSQVSFNGGRWN